MKKLVLFALVTAALCSGIQLSAEGYYDANGNWVSNWDQYGVGAPVVGAADFTGDVVGGVFGGHHHRQRKDRNNQNPNYRNNQNNSN